MKRCPFLKKDCIEDKCMLFSRSVKTEVTTQKQIPLNTCTLNLIPDMLLDVIKNTNGTQAAVEHRGNEQIKRQDTLLTILDTARRKQIADSA